MDVGGDWGWGRISGVELRRVRDWVCNMEKLTWNEARNPRGPGCKPVSLNSSNAAAAKIKDRLLELKQDDVDGLYEFHLDGLTRFWGLRRGHVCHLLWWDPNHEIWPANLRNT